MLNSAKANAWDIDGCLHLHFPLPSMNMLKQAQPAIFDVFVFCFRLFLGVTSPFLYFN